MMLFRQISQDNLTPASIAIFRDLTSLGWSVELADFINRKILRAQRGERTVMAYLQDGGDLALAAREHIEGCGAAGSSEQ